jgi:hypothetical protein
MAAKAAGAEMVCGCFNSRLAANWIVDGNQMDAKGPQERAQ